MKNGVLSIIERKEPTITIDVEEPVITIEEITDNTNKQLSIASPQVQDIVEAEQEEKANTDLLVKHTTVMKIAGTMTTVGGTVGGYIAREMAPEIAEKVSHAVEAEVKKQGEEITAKILEATGLKNVPGANLLCKAEVTDLAHKLGQEAYENTVNVVTTKGAAIGSTVAGLGTIAVLEAANGFNYLYQNYAKPSFMNYFNRRKEHNLALESQLNANKAMSQIKGVDATVENSDDADLDDIVVVNYKSNKK